MNPSSVLIIDDDSDLLDSLATALSSKGFEVACCADPKEALELVEKINFEIVVVDLAMPEINGIEFVEICKDKGIDSCFVIMTAYGSHDVAIDAIRRGAYDYIDKPFGMNEIVLLLKKIEERERLRLENKRLKEEVAKTYGFGSIVCRSVQMKEIIENIKRICKYDSSVLILGESGVGKELIAKAIHYNSQRKTMPFIALNCASIPDELVESELFGHMRGSFTDATTDRKGLFETADGGTIFLDEIGDMPLHIQPKLLRALQEGVIRRIGGVEDIRIDVRLISATNVDLEERVKQKLFREDLFYRLNVVTVRVPPLRERKSDIEVLVYHFIDKFNSKHKKGIKGVAASALHALLAYDWPGNVRELENVIERAYILAEGDIIQESDLKLTDEYYTVGSTIEIGDNLSIKKHTRQLEITLIKKALEQTEGKREKAAKLLEISERTLLYKIKEYGLTDWGKKR